MRRAAEANDHRAHVDADFAFHHTIIKAAGNDMLEHVWQSMRLATTTLVTHAMIQMTHRSMREIGERHVTVLEALRVARSAAGRSGDAPAHRGAGRVDSRGGPQGRAEGRRQRAAADPAAETASKRATAV